MRSALRAAQKLQLNNTDRTIAIHNTIWTDDEGTEHKHLSVCVMIDDTRCRTLHADRFETPKEFEAAIQDAIWAL